MKNNPHCLPFQGSPTTWLSLSPILICQTHPYPEAFALAVFIPLFLESFLQIFAWLPHFSGLRNLGPHASSNRLSLITTH